MEDFLSRLSSRKFLLTLALFIVLTLNGVYDLGLDQNEIVGLFVTVGGFVGVEGINDILKNVPAKADEVVEAVSAAEETFTDPQLVEENIKALNKLTASQ